MSSCIDLGNGKFKLYVELGYDAKGKRKRRTRVIKASGPRAANKALSEFEEEIRHTQHIQIDQASFADFAERWVINYVRPELEATTEELYEGLLGNITEYFQRLKLKDVRTLHIVEYLRIEKEEGRGSLEKKYNILKSIFKHAILWNVLDVNPMEGISKPKLTKQQIDFYDKTEISVLLRLIESLKEHQRLMVKLALIGGLRRGEVLGIASNVIDYKKNQIQITRSLQHSKKYGFRLKGTKTENIRTVTFPNEVMNELKTYHFKIVQLKMEMGNLWKGFKDIKGQEVFLLFSDEYGGPRRPDFVTSFWGRFMQEQKTEIKRIRFQDLRHSSASLLLSEGINMKILQKRLGHANIKTTLDIYSHITEKDDEKASDVFKKMLC